MKPFVIKCNPDESGNITFQYQDLEKLIDLVYEAGLADGNKVTVVLCKDCTKELYDILKQIPTADVVGRKRGKWIRHSIGHENTPWGFDCSVCGKWFVIGEDTAERYHFCPNCGAEMKGEDDG